ncbi:hypothetical protein [Falsirhodobacter halotolerans]|uniref:hypothetical protein n=1 Tax=Falsirhodobacter halotolerans TaxID=1146892 RepID=UPI001FD3B162|nr:hypothetical protein [Falsirhodobacter halotolerans]MCJ8138608.1 hypothetical protein [Falsirhodobacter halotolerans]
MAQEPDLVISAGFSDAQLVREADRIVAMYRKKGQEAQKAFQDSQGRVTNTAAARAHVRELDRLSKAYDPVYRASRQYEAEVRRLDRALELGVLTQQQYTAQVERAASEMRDASAATRQVAGSSSSLYSAFRRGDDGARGLAGSAAGVGRNMGAMRAQIQNASFQIGDFAVQVGSGQSAMVALGQQLPQFLGAFGVVGAVLGTVAAIAIPVSAALFRVGRDSEDAAKQSEAFDKALGDVRSAMGEFADAIDTRAVGSVDDMIERFGRADEAVKQLMDRLRDAAREDAFKGFGLSIDEAVKTLDGAQERVAQIFGRLAALRDEQAGVKERLDALGNPLADRGVSRAAAEQYRLQFQLRETQAEFERLNAEVAEFGISPAQIETFNAAWRILDEMLAAENFTGAADQLAVIQGILRATGSKEAVDVANSLDEVGTQLREGAKEAGEVARRAEDISLAAAGISFDGAVQGAQTLADVLAAAARNMASMESSQAQQLARAQIRGQYVGDPVGEAGALARLEYRDENLPRGTKTTPQQRRDFRERLDAYVEGAKEIAREEQKTLAAERAAAEAARGGRGGGGGGGGSAAQRTPTDIFANTDTNLTGLERQIDLIGKSSTEVARLQAQWAIMDEAKRAGIPLNDEMNAKISAQADEVARLTGELERGQLAQQQFDNAIDSIAGSLSSLITSGQSVRESLGNIFRGIANDIVKSGIQSALSRALTAPAAGGGGGFGGLLTKVFGGFRADGGPVSPGKAYVVGERGPEVIVPRAMGSVIPNHKLGGGSSGSTIMIDMTGATGNAEVQNMVRAGVTEGLRAYDSAMPNRVQTINRNPRFR